MVAGVLGDGGEYVSSLLRKEVLNMANQEAEKILQEDLGVVILSAFPKILIYVMMIQNIF